MRALPHGEVAATIRTVQAATAPEVAKLAFEFLVLTAARWSEVRWAEWEEIDRDEGVWTVPASRMKANRKHRVPLCGRALEILEAARRLGKGAGPLVFTRRGGKPLNDKELRWLVREQGIAAVPHGFRSSFRDWAAEETDHPREVIEAALAHVVRDRVEAASRLCPLGPVRAPACPDGRLVALPDPRDRLPPPGPARRPRPGQARDRATPEGRRPSRPG